MQYGLFFGKHMQFIVEADDERSAWRKVKKAGVHNTSRSLNMVKIDYEPGFYDVTQNVLGKKRLVIPSEDSIKMVR